MAWWSAREDRHGLPPAVLFRHRGGLEIRGRAMLMRALLAAALVLPAVPASAQFYKSKTLTLLVNYGAGGNADTEARIYQHYLSKHIAGNPTVIILNAPAAGGAVALHPLTLNSASQAHVL